MTFFDNDIKYKKEIAQLQLKLSREVYIQKLIYSLSILPFSTIVKKKEEYIWKRIL
nr:MAG TPA: hypothetical protein [Caudoviricetes sp.]